eukprot:5997640-Amphidinium_carterae.1
MSVQGLDSPDHKEGWEHETIVGSGGLQANGHCLNDFVLHFKLAETRIKSWSGQCFHRHHIKAARSSAEFQPRRSPQSTRCCRAQ